MGSTNDNMEIKRMKSLSRNKASIQKVTWSEVRKKVIEINPLLGKLIDDLSLSNKYALFHASYPFGSEIVQEGLLYLPNNKGQLCPYNSPELNSSYQKLGYNLGSNPTSLILNNTLEVYLHVDHYTIPFLFIPDGKLVGLWLILNPANNHQPAFLWHISAGARSLFMLPKISIEKKHERLKKEFGVEIEKPSSLVENGLTFRSLYNTEAFGEHWSTELLFFGKEWFDHLDDPAWLPFAKHLYESSWKNTEFWRNEFLWELVFSLIQKRGNLKPNPYIADTVKHLLSMCIGAYPGFTPAIDNSVAPISRLQQIYSDIYDLKYAPIIMQPQYFNKKNTVYYSLAYPTTISFSPKSKSTANKITELKEIKHLLNKYLEAIKSGDLNLHQIPLAQLPKTIGFEYFHTTEFTDSIQDTTLLFEKDPSFKQAMKNFTQAILPSKSNFLRGCIKISSLNSLKDI